ncbi:MAG TPA: PAS domain S-box protein [Candidatus Omnitrophota bacterium]|nr:PAS domain S-box protein [Candidatus Omnitrophota bacterium]HPT39125.1 PAS domain S-box protein [Candidatus Omnitrophota bacterium]
MPQKNRSKEELTEEVAILQKRIAELELAISQCQNEKTRLQAYTAHLSYLTKYANDFIMLLDKDFRFLEINERATDFYGYTREELLGMYAVQVRAPETRKDFDWQVKDAQISGKAVYETIHRRKDGTQFPVEISLRAIDVEGKRLYQAIIRDITERKKLEEIAQKRIKELEVFYKVSAGREERILELKKELEELRKERPKN